MSELLELLPTFIKIFLTLFSFSIVRFELRLKVLFSGFRPYFNKRILKQERAESTRDRLQDRHFRDSKSANVSLSPNMRGRNSGS